MVTFDLHTRIVRGEDDVRSNRIRSGIHANHVAGIQIIRLKHRADRRLGCGRRQSIVCVVSRRGSPIARLNRRVVYIVDSDRQRDRERGIARIGHGRPHASDTNAIVCPRRRGFRNRPHEFAIIQRVVGQ